MSTEREIADAAEIGRLRQDNLRLVDIVTRQQAELKRFYDALAAIVAQIEDYERVNKLSPNPPRMSCWDTVAAAKELLK
jgi:hypothetical protein